LAAVEGSEGIEDVVDRDGSTRAWDLPPSGAALECAGVRRPFGEYSTLLVARQGWMSEHLVWVHDALAWWENPRTLAQLNVLSERAMHEFPPHDATELASGRKRSRLERRTGNGTRLLGGTDL
jgi:hypothetical protein